MLAEGIGLPYSSGGVPVVEGLVVPQSASGFHRPKPGRRFRVSALTTAVPKGNGEAGAVISQEGT